MSTEANATADHDRSRRWVEAPDGAPAAVAATASENESADQLDTIQWDEFFAKLDAAFLYQKAADGGTSRFHKLVRRS